MKWNFQISQFLSFDYLDYLVDGQREDTVLAFVEAKCVMIQRLKEFTDYKKLSSHLADTYQVGVREEEAPDESQWILALTIGPLKVMPLGIIILSIMTFDIMTL
jgi:hypothetical protein